MKINFEKRLVLGIVTLLLVNVLEFRSGKLLAAVQLVLGLAVFMPKLIDTNISNKINLYRPILKWLYLFALGWGIYSEWYYVPNHLFLFFFLSVLVLTSEDEYHIKDNLRWIFVIIMGFAAIHKLLNPVFLSGDYIGYRLASGNFFKPIWMSGILPEISENLTQNAAKVSEFKSQDPLLGQMIMLRMDFILFSWLVKTFSYVVIAMEFLLVLLFTLFSKTRAAMATLLIFVASIGFAVPEFEFASTLLFMGLVVCPDNFNVLKKLYLLSFLVYVVLSVWYNHF